jgi:hypothetical protein
MPLRGWVVKPLRSVDGERRLIVACITQALLDARKGDVEAWRWLDTTGRRWCELLGIDGVEDWQAAALRMDRCRRELAATPAEQERKRAKKRVQNLSYYHKARAQRVEA